MRWEVTEAGGPCGMRSKLQKWRAAWEAEVESCVPGRTWFSLTWFSAYKWGLLFVKKKEVTESTGECGQGSNHKQHLNT